jgi:hypothetical protein
MLIDTGSQAILSITRVPLPLHTLDTSHDARPLFD